MSLQKSINAQMAEQNLLEQNMQNDGSKKQPYRVLQPHTKDNRPKKGGKSASNIGTMKPFPIDASLPNAAKPSNYKDMQGDHAAKLNNVALSS